MSIEKLKHMKMQLTNCVQTQIDKGLKQVNTNQLGQAIDMIKDLSEAIYYCTIVESMEKSDQNQQHSNSTNRLAYGQQAHKDKKSQLHELKEYLNELSANFGQIIKDASSDQKAMLRQKMVDLANKIN